MRHRFIYADAATSAAQVIVSYGVIAINRLFDANETTILCRPICASAGMSMMNAIYLLMVKAKLSCGGRLTFDGARQINA